MTCAFIHPLIVALALQPAPAPEGPAPPAAIERPVTPAQPRAPARAPLGKAEKTMIAAAATFGFGIALQWSVAAATHRLEPDGGGGTRYELVPPYVIGSVFAGSSLAMSAALSGIAGRELARDRPDDRRRSRLLRGFGGALTAVGAAGLLGTTVLWPELVERCPVGHGCTIAGLHGSGAALALGAGMLAHGVAIDPEPRRLPEDVAAPLAIGVTLLGLGYLNAVFFATRFDAADEVAEDRVREQLLIPFAGPWLVAAGPDVNWFAAAFCAGAGLMQLGGGAALVVAGARAAGGHEKHVSTVRVIPTARGVALSGRF